MSTSTYESVNLSTVHSFLKRQSTSTSSGGTVVSYTHDLGQGPVLWLIHGYPQSAFIWRHVAPLLKDKISLFIPERPGYGISTRTSSSTQRDVGAALIEASNALFPGRPIILGGHDRGARLCHRLAVDHAHPPTPLCNSFELLGTVFLDIVPTTIQWQSFANPKASVGYFHWPFLAFPDSADIIDAYGGDKWVHNALERISGSNEAGTQAFKSDHAWEVYESLFAKRETIDGSCADYAAAAEPETSAQNEDQAKGRKVEVPLLIMWSLAKLGQMHGDVGSIWKDWVKEGVPLTGVGCGEGVGHYLPEETSEFIASNISDFMSGLKA